MESTVPHSAASIISTFRYAAADVTATKLYIACEYDDTIHYKAQLAMARAAEAKVTTIPFGHSPFVRPDGAAQIVEIIETAASKA